MKINFKKIETKISFEGDVQTFGIAKRIANAMKYQTTVLMDIGFEKLAEAIYYSEGEVEIPSQYCNAIIEVVRQSPFIAAVKREVINRLSINQKQDGIY